MSIILFTAAAAKQPVPAGTQGTIVLEYDGTAFEVEFFDKDGHTLDVLTTPKEFIKLA